MINIINFILLLDFFIINIIIFPIYKNFHPLIYRILLGIYSLFLVIKINLLFNLYFYSYILYLLIVGGIIILILYLTRISNNELFSLEFFGFINLIIKIFFNIIIIIIIFIFNNLFNINIINIRIDLKSLKNIILLDLFDINIEFIFIKINFIIYLLIYLFILIIVVVLICTIIIIPLRHLKN